MQTIPGSNYGKKLSQLGEMYFVIDYRDPICNRRCLKIYRASQCKRKIFDATGAHCHWFIWRHTKSKNFQNYLPPKFCDARR